MNMSGTSIATEALAEGRGDHPVTLGVTDRAALGVTDRAALGVTALVPTFRRPDDLRRCLRALQAQTLPPREIIVVVRPEDEATQALLADESGELPEVRVVFVEPAGQVAALNAGLAAAGGDIVAITDDDTAPRPDWIERIAGHFASDDSIGAVGGRDWVHEHGRLLDGERQTVGKVGWFGRVTGNHHLGAGPTRFVDVLKGANMSYRRKAIVDLQFDSRLRGAGAQVSNDLAFSLRVRRSGWRIVYDPLAAVDHYPSARFDEDQRQAFNPAALENAAHNETVALLDYLPAPRRAAYFVWSLLVGTSALPGLAQIARLLPARGSLAIAQGAAVRRGRIAGWKTWRRRV